MYPRFHCECNFIERVWGETKRRARLDCDYSYSSLKQRVPVILDTIPVEKIRKFARRSWRFIEAYTRKDNGSCLGGRKAAYIVKTYKSHRRLPVTMDFSEYNEAEQYMPEEEE
ncbi:hypothetical protein LIPSTDRAFT_5026 [Lipomyces starkeyi NRRL Y-11557]|uniref:Uncharacterized protein n=1 Tax=Lipomyces starkeyi NRRL Y-11557 TaxID=675824 RepID=A0A1E3Q3R2_LIPST|nr:hypothetical protein LIPSTDRAFT_5026 [Lipomyces starkeyi NRRL Y-11557]